MAVPTPGGQLEKLNNLLSDPTVQIVARLAKLPTITNPDEVSIGGITECDFPGYVPFVYTPNLATAAEEEFYAEMGLYKVEFQVGAIVTPQRIVGIYVTSQKDGGDLNLESFVAFDPVLFATAQGQVFAFDGTLAALQILGS